MRLTRTCTHPIPAIRNDALSYSMFRLHPAEAYVTLDPLLHTIQMNQQPFWCSHSGTQGNMYSTAITGCRLKTSREPQHIEKTLRLVLEDGNTIQGNHWNLPSRPSQPTSQMISTSLLENWNNLKKPRVVARRLGFHSRKPKKNKKTLHVSGHAQPPFPDHASDSPGPKVFWFFLVFSTGIVTFQHRP